MFPSTTSHPLSRFSALLALALAAQSVRAQTITAPYTTSVSGALTSGTQDVDNDGATTTGRITVDTAGGISGGTQNFNGHASLAVVGGGSLTGGTQNFAGHATATGVIDGGTQNFSGSYNELTNLTLTGGDQNFSGTRADFDGASSITGGALTVTNGAIYWISSGTITGGTMTLQNSSTLFVASGSLAGANLKLQNSATLSNAFGAANLTGATTNLTFDAAGNGGGSGGALYLYGHDTTIGKIGSIAGGGRIDGGAGVGATTTLTVNFAGKALPYGGTLEDGSSGGILALAKSGSGVLALAGANTYSGGTTIHAGTLAAMGEFSTRSSLGAGAVTVGSGGTLTGNDYITGAVTVHGGGHLAPEGTLRFDGGLALEAGAVLDLVLSPAAPNFLALGSGAVLAGPSSGSVTINLADYGDFTAGTYALIDWSSGSAPGLLLTQFALGSTIAGYDYTLALNGSRLDLVAVAAVPEPSTSALLLGSGTLGLLALRRRRAGLSSPLN